jgi:TonB-dependent starch-binding outer membrane protein SusC
MKRISMLFLLITLSLYPDLVFAQKVQVQGKVFDHITNESLPGVSVVVKGIPGAGTVTGLDGGFTIAVSDSSTLQFSFVGYGKEEIKVNGTETLQVFLAQEVTELDMLVIVGAVVKKSDLTGAVARVSSEELKKIPTANINQALQGKIPGVYIQSNPAPGSKASIKIRGSNSIQYGTNPIYVVDGLVIEGGIDMLNPDDIATIDILKDASATAIYGSRGANGVVVITTKKGKKGTRKISYDAWFGFQSFSNEMPLMSGAETYDLRVDAYANSYMDKHVNADREKYIKNSLTNTNPLKNLIFSAVELEAYAESASYNWLNEITQPGFQQNHAVSFSGGDDNGSFFLSFNYNEQTGQVVNSGYKRYSGKINLEQNIRSWLRVGTNNTLIFSKENPVANDNMYITALRACPLLPISEEYWYMKEGKIDNQSSSNPLRDLHIDKDVISQRILSSNYININPIKGLDVRSTYSMDLLPTEDYTYYPTTSTQSYKSTLNGQSVQIKSRNFNWQWDNSITYNKVISDKHRLTALVGTNMSYYSYNYNQQNANGYNNDLFSYMYSQGASDKENFYLGSDFSTYSLMSYLFRVNYTYNSKYYLTLTGRSDGSSKFGPEYKWGYFPAIAVSWNVINEEFMKSQQIVNNLKIRTGYGIAGNQNIPNYGYLTRYNPSISLGSSILTNNGRYGNPYLRWEKQKQMNIGMDAGFLNNRIDFALDFFKINNEDLLMERSTAPSSGYLTKIDNVGAMENKGVEFSLNASIIEKKDFTWNFSFNIASDKNKITQLYGDVTEIYNLGGYSNNEIQREGNLFLGQPINTIYVYEFDRIVQESDMDYVNSLQMGSRIVKPGDALPKDRDHNGIINDSDRYAFGKRDPDFYGGFSTNLNYKGIELNIHTNFSKGAHRVSYLYETLMGGVGNSAAHEDLLNRWTPGNTNTNVPRAYSDGGRYGLGEMDWAIQDASFFRLSDLTLSYTLPKNILSMAKLDNFRIYVTGHNLVLITPYKGYDPESGDWYPSSRMYIMGVNMSF